jgi:hypothetical protein
MAELERLGTMTTPVAVVGDREEVVVGYNRVKLTQLLGL